MIFPCKLEHALELMHVSKDFVLVYPSKYIYIENEKMIKDLMNENVISIKILKGKLYVILD